MCSNNKSDFIATMPQNYSINFKEYPHFPIYGIGSNAVFFAKVHKVNMYWVGHIHPSTFNI